MTVDIPRRLRPRAEKRNNTLTTQTRGAPSAKATTAASRPVVTTRRANIYTAKSGANMGRLAVLWSFDTTGASTTDKVYFGSGDTWVVDEDLGGMGVSTTSYGLRIHLAGIYAVHLFVHGEGMQNAAADCVTIATCDYFAPFTESFSCSTRGGDPSSGRLFPSTSRTYYFPAGSDLEPSLAWANLDLANVSELILGLQVQQISGSV